MARRESPTVKSHCTQIGMAFVFEGGNVFVVGSEMLPGFTER
jgi:hypothetical protein